MKYIFKYVGILNGRPIGYNVCFNVEDITSVFLNRATIKGKNMLPIGSIFFPLREAPMRIEK